MDQLTLCYLLLLPLSLCFDNKVTLVKTIGREPDATPICTNANLSTITLIACKIRPEKSGEECLLYYEYGRDFVHKCDSRFALMMKNQTVFLDLTSLTPVDSGTYTCECSHAVGTDVLHLNIIVEEEEDTSTSTNQLMPIVISYFFWTLVTIVIIVTIVITGVIFGFVCRRIRHGCTRPTASGSSVVETPGSLDKDDPDNPDDPDDPDDPYTSLQHPASDLYQTISDSASSRPIVMACLNNQEIDGREADSSCEIYENI